MIFYKRLAEDHGCSTLSNMSKCNILCQIVRKLSCHILYRLVRCYDDFSDDITDFYDVVPKCNKHISSARWHRLDMNIFIFTFKKPE